MLLIKKMRARVYCKWNELKRDSKLIESVWKYRNYPVRCVLCVCKAFMDFPVNRFLFVYSSLDKSPVILTVSRVHTKMQRSSSISVGTPTPLAQRAPITAPLPVDVSTSPLVYCLFFCPYFIFTEVPIFNWTRIRSNRFTLLLLFIILSFRLFIIICTT